MRVFFAGQGATTGRGLALALMLLSAIVTLALTPAVLGADDDYDHETTTLPTEGAHRGLDCEDCHLNDDYETTPKDCRGCHDGGIALGLPIGHMSVREDCSACHNTVSFRIPPHATRATEFDHELTGFPLEGAHRTLVCSDCHRLPLFRGTPSRCMICHDGI
ncbi:MAG: hypothetical protein RLZ44_1848, partial [Pseudomonadota bacterium]